MQCLYCTCGGPRLPRHPDGSLDYAAIARMQAEHEALKDVNLEASSMEAVYFEL